MFSPSVLQDVKPSSDGDQTARLWPLDFPHPLPIHSVVNLDPDGVRAVFGEMRAGLTPFFYLFQDWI